MTDDWNGEREMADGETRGRERRVPMNERTILLAAVVEAASTRQADVFDWLVKATYYGAGASRRDLVLAVETGRRLDNPPEFITAGAYATVHAWQWMASRRKARGGEPAPSAEGSSSERREGSLPCTTK